MTTTTMNIYIQNHGVIHVYNNTNNAFDKWVNSASPQQYSNQNANINMNYINQNIHQQQPSFTVVTPIPQIHQPIQQNQSNQFTQNEQENNFQNSSSSPSNPLFMEEIDINPIEMKHQSTNDEINQVKSFLDTLNSFKEETKLAITATSLTDILSISSVEIDLLKKWSERSNYQVIYRATNDGLDKRILMKKCSGHQNVYFLVKYDSTNVIGFYIGDQIPPHNSSGPTFLSAINFFITLLKHSQISQPFRLKRFNPQEKGFIIGASDEYVNRIFGIFDFMGFSKNYKYFIHENIHEKFFCVENKSLNFEKYFNRQGYFQELIAIEMM